MTATADKSSLPLWCGFRFVKIAIYVDGRLRVSLDQEIAICGELSTRHRAERFFGKHQPLSP